MVFVHTETGVYAGGYEYDAWGEHKIYDASGNQIESGDNIGIKNPIRYRGYYFDSELYLYYLQSRYYEPILGRFLSPDSPQYLDPTTIQGLNLYTYCLNNPISYVDPNGTSFTALVLIIFGIILSGIITGAVAAVTASPEESKGGAFLGGFVSGVFSASGIAIGAAIPVGKTFVATAMGFLGGLFGNAISQKISYGDVDWNLAAIAGGINALQNMLVFTGSSMAGLLDGATPLERFENAAEPSLIGAGISTFVLTLPIPNVNSLRKGIRNRLVLPNGMPNYFYEHDMGIQIW